MSKIFINFRVAVSACEPWLGYDKKDSSNKWRRNAEKLEEEIKRHCDDVEGTDIECDCVCEFCDWAWETEENGCPVCCNDAIKEWEERNEKRNTDNKEKQTG